MQQRWKKSSIAFVWLSMIATPGVIHAQTNNTEQREALNPQPRVTPLWFATQLIPSPIIAAEGRQARFGLRWQVTPLLYSWGINRKLSGWRVLVVEPLVRHMGSVEFYASPEIYVGSEVIALLRPGMRAYLPLVEHGEYLSASLGVSYQRAQGHDRAAIEIGLYALYGTLGIQVTHAPGPTQPLHTMVSLSLRYF